MKCTLLNKKIEVIFFTFNAAVTWSLGWPGCDFCWYYYAPAPNRWGIKRWFCLTSVCLTSLCLSRTSGITQEQRPRKTKIGTSVAHVTCDLDTAFKVKRSRSPGRFSWLFKSLHNLYGWHHNLHHRPERAAACRSWIFKACWALQA